MRSSIKFPERQEAIIRSYYENGTDQEKRLLDSLLDREDVHPEVKDMIQKVRTLVDTCGQKAILGIHSISPFRFNTVN